MNVDQLDELIRKYLSTGVAVVLVLVGPAAAPSGQRPVPTTAATSAHSTGAAPTNSRAPSHHDTDRTHDARHHRAHDDGGAHRNAAAAEPSRRHHLGPGGPRPLPRATPRPTGHARLRATTARPPQPPTTGAPPTARTTSPTDLSGWGIYDGPGHANKGTRSPGAAKVADGVLTIDGDAEGTTAGMAWGSGEGQKYGRWEGRVRAPASDPTYNALLLLWPDAEDFPRGGEIDFMEMTDHTRQATNVFLHHGEDNAQEHGIVKIDATQWHNWAVEWTPKGITTYVDGKPWWHTDNTAALPPGPMHLCIQLDWFPQKGDGAVKPSQMQVDWVRQYPLDAPPCRQIGHA